MLRRWDFLVQPFATWIGQEGNFALMDLALYPDQSLNKTSSIHRQLGNNLETLGDPPIVKNLASD